MIQRPAPLKARSDLHLAALVDARNAETLGLGATDAGVANGATVNYSLVAAAAGGRDGATLGVLNGFRVGADAPPPAPTGLLFFQDEEEVHLRWTRLPAAVETRLLAASYRIQRFTPPSPAGANLTPRPLMIMDVDGKEPASFFVDELARPGTYRYQLVLVDGFGRASPPAVLAVSAEEWRRPDPPAKAYVGPGAAFRDAFKAGTRGEFRLPILTARASSPPVTPTVAWRSCPPLDGMAVKYLVYRYSLDQPNVAATKLTPAPIDGTILAVQTDAQLEAAIDAVFGPAYLDDMEAKVQLIANRPAKTAAEIQARARDAAKARAKLEIVKRTLRASFQALPPRQFVDAGAPRDGRYFYSITALYAPLGLESQESAAGSIDVPDLTPPPAVSLGAPKFTAAPAPPKTFAKSPPKTSRPAFVADQIRARSQIAKSPLVRPGKPANPKSPLTMQRLPLKLSLPPSDFGGTLDISWTGLNRLGIRYRIRRRIGSEPFADVALTAPGAVTFRDRLPRSRARTYDYEIAAISRWNVIGATAQLKVPVPATVPPDVPNVLSAAVGNADGEILVRVELAGSDQGIAKYRFFRDNQAAGEVLASTAQGGVVTYRDQGRNPGVRHAYTVEAETAAGIKSPRSTAIFGKAVKTVAAPPTGLTGNPGPTGVLLTWTAAPGATGYVVRRKIGNSPATVLVARHPAIAFTDIHAMRGRTYVYEVSAVDAQGNVSVAVSVSVAVP